MPDVLNVGSGHGTSLAELVALIEQEVGKPARVASRPERGFEIERIVLDIERLRRLLGLRAAPAGGGDRPHPRLAGEHDRTGSLSVFANAISGIRWRLRATRRIWRPDATHGMPLLPTEPIPDGRLDAPTPGELLPREIAWVRGWATFPTGPCSRVEVHLGGELLGLARLGVARSDLARRLDATAGLSGFELKADLATWSGPDGDTLLRCVAHGPGGERHEISATVTVVPVREPPEIADAGPQVSSTKTASGAIRTLVFTHQLTLGGAQLYLLDLLREMTKRNLVEATVLSTMDGPVRDDLDELGIPSHITSISVAEGASAHAGRVEELVAWAQGRGFEAMLVNTATVTTFPGVEVAKRLGIPALWAIHGASPGADLGGPRPAGA